MMRSISGAILLGLVTYVSASAISINKRASPLDVTLTALGNTEVKVAVTNNGDRALNLLSKGTILDEANPVEKVTVYSANSKLAFEGIKIRLLISGLSQDDFVSLGIGQTKEVTIETASLHTMNSGGKFDVFAQGTLPYAEFNSTILSGSLAYGSNKLVLNVNGSEASKVAKAISKRTNVGSSCTGTKLSAVRTALSNCQKLATSAASAATSGNKLTTYFKSSSASTESTVSARLRAVASDCGGSGSATSTNCNDPYQGCSTNVLAYTVPSANFITYCNIYFTALPALASSCHAQDQATTTIHEETHAPGVYSPGTDDIAYGYAAASQLSTSQALNNADSYALYSNAIYLNC